MCKLNTFGTISSHQNKRFMRFFLCSLLLVLCTGMYAQEMVDTVMMRRIRTEAFDNSGITPIAQQLTDVAGPRLTNSPGYQRAATMAIAALKQWGIEKAGLEPWGQFGKGWSNEQITLALRTPYYQPLEAMPIAWTN